MREDDIHESKRREVSELTEERGNTSGSKGKPETNEGKGITRRKALKASTMAAGGAVGFSAVGSTATAATSHDITFDRVLHAVDDLGMDPTGKDPIDELIDWREGTLIEFPSGEFTYDGDWMSGLTRYGWAAENSQADPTLVPAEDIHNTSTITFVYWDEGEDLLFQGIDIDFTNPEHGGFLSMKIASGVGYWEDVTVDGPFPDHTDYTAFFSPYTTSESARLEVRNFTAMDGWEGYTKDQGANANYHPIGVWVAYLHTGEVLFDNCSIGYWPDNGLYADGAGLDTDNGYAIEGGGGTVMVKNCYFENNNITNIRLGTSSSYAKNCEVVIDDNCPTHANGSNARGAWLRYEGDITLNNVDMEITGHRGSAAIEETAYTRSNDVRNCNIHVSSNANYTTAIRRTSSAEPTGSTYQNVCLTSGLDQSEISDGHAAFEINETVDMAIRNCNVETTSPDKDGIEFVDSTATVINTNVNATGTPIVEENSTVTKRHVTHDNSLPGHCRRGRPSNKP